MSVIKYGCEGLAGEGEWGRGWGGGGGGGWGGEGGGGRGNGCICLLALPRLKNRINAFCAGTGFMKHLHLTNLCI